MMGCVYREIEILQQHLHRRRHISRGVILSYYYEAMFDFFFFFFLCGGVGYLELQNFGNDMKTKNHWLRRIDIKTPRGILLYQTPHEPLVETYGEKGQNGHVMMLKS